MKSSALRPKFAVTAFAIAWTHTMRAFLVHLADGKKLSPVERKYVRELGPAIWRAEMLRFQQTMGGTVSDGGNHTEVVTNLQDAARNEMTAAGVSESRQRLLEQMVADALEIRCIEDSWRHLPENPGQVAAYVRKRRADGTLTSAITLAEESDAPGYIKVFLEQVGDYTDHCRK